MKLPEKIKKQNDRVKKWKKEHPEKIKEWALRDKEQNRKRALEYYHNNKDKLSAKGKERGHASQRDYSLKKRIGISLKEYNQYVKKKKTEQNNKCAICNREKKLELDHDHTTNKLRGLLCHSCNVALGFLKEDKKSISKMLDYLEIYANEKSFSGTCVCGHTWDEHHHGVAFGYDGVDCHDGIIGEECEHSRINGKRVNEQDPVCSCIKYWDKDWNKNPNETLDFPKLKEAREYLEQYRKLGICVVGIETYEHAVLEILEYYRRK